MEENKTKEKITSSAKIISVDIGGVIGVPEQEQFHDEECDHIVSTYERFREAVAEIDESGADKVVINIRSTGGDLNDALMIYDAASALGVEVVTRCYGYVASAATVIAQAASKGSREISANALYLIHCCESSVEGNSHSLSLTKQLLDKSDERLVEIYASTSGRGAEEFRKLMNENGGKGRWLSPQEALQAGLVDRIIPAAPITDSALREVALLGLPALPEAAASGGQEGFWSSLLGRVGLRRRDVSSHNSAVSEEVPAEVGGVEMSSAEIAAPIGQPTVASRLHTARPTLTKECEDPAFGYGEAARDDNKSAYEADARSLREAVSQKF